MLNLLAQDTPPPASMVDVLMWPVGLTLLACVIFYGGWWFENRLTKAPWKWVALAPVVYAIYLGIDAVIKYQDPFYNNLVNMNGGKKMAAAHYGALIFPVVGLAAIILFHFFNHKLNLSSDD